MASRSFEEDLSCPVCCDIFVNPVVLSCSHSICEDCVQRFWENKRLKECPVCRRRSSKEHPPVNRALKNLCETYQQKLSRRSSFGGESVCGLHNEKLKLFCLDDQEPVCLVCRDARKHTDHKFCPIEEAVMNNKVILRDALEQLEEKQAVFEGLKWWFNDGDEQFKCNAQHAERQIKAEFEELHQFLRDEEAARITALREEGNRRSQMMKQKIDEMSRQISSLSCTIRDVEEQMKDVSFLQNFNATLQRAQCNLTIPEPTPAVTVDFSNHLTNLKLNVLQKMQDNLGETPVTLDPNTAHCNLLVSDDLTSVRFSDEEKLLPDNLERFDSWECVLGSEGFDSGVHCWDIEVGDLTNWTFGVMTESAQRKDDILTKKGLWVLGYASGEYYAFITPEQSPPLPVKKKLQKIRVQLNYEEGKLSFIDPLNNTDFH